jgi:hypothetical protein
MTQITNYRTALEQALEPFEALFKQAAAMNPVPANVRCQIAMHDLRALIYAYDALTAGRAALAQPRGEEEQTCGICGYTGKETDSVGQCPKCHWDELKPSGSSALRSALNAMLTQFGMDEDEWNKPTFDQARAALTHPQASEPAQGERESFEAWIAKDGGDLSIFGSGQNIHYRNSAVNNSWVGWKARAALQSTEQPDHIGDVNKMVAQPVGELTEILRKLKREVQWVPGKHYVTQLEEIMNEAAAYLQAQPVRWEPVDEMQEQIAEMSQIISTNAFYQEGHKDGLEWAAQSVEYNDPQTGDWMWDDRNDLANAIRKGPEMPVAQPERKPLTPEQKLDMLAKANRGFNIEKDDYFKAVEDTEAAHGINGGQQ